MEKLRKLQKMQEMNLGVPVEQIEEAESAHFKQESQYSEKPEARWGETRDEEFIPANFMLRNEH